MPVAHYPRQLGNPLTDIFGTGQATVTTPSAPGAVSSTASPTGLPTDPLGGITSVIASIFSPPPSSVTSATTPSTTSIISIPTTTSSTLTSADPTTTIDVTATTTPSATQSSSTSSSPSPSPSASATPTNHTVAATVAGVLVAVFALVLIISFFLRRWNRSRSRVRPRESINFNPEEFRRAGTTLGDDRSEQKYMEQKVYAGSAYHAPSMGAHQPGPGTYPPEYLHPQQPQQIYSPHPHHTYPTAAQQVAFEYRGESAPRTSMSYNDNMPNPHPITHPADEAYGGI
ncbi:hypothetical protein B0H19DRAFT_1125149 [Mycena capillaripes]|nr:hypothetical protein B0H19DRAFT_1125149 [Mycena capillaripes]